MKLLVITLSLAAASTCQAAVISTFVDEPATIGSSGQPWDTASVTIAIDLSNTTWVAWNDLSEVLLTHASRPGETFLGPGGSGVDDFIRITVTNPLGASQTVDFDNNTIWGNSYGQQNVIYGSSADAPDAYRRSPSFGKPGDTDYFFDEAGAFNSIFTETGDYTFKFDFMDNSSGPSSHGNVYLLVDATPEPIKLMNDQAVELRWASISGLTYQVQYSTNMMSTNWFDLGASMLGDGSTNSVFDTTRNNSERFYRVITEQY